MSRKRGETRVGRGLGRENTNYPWRPHTLNDVLVHLFTRCTTPAEPGPSWKGQSNERQRRVGDVAQLDPGLRRGGAYSVRALIEPAETFRPGSGLRAEATDRYFFARKLLNRSISQRAPDRMRIASRSLQIMPSGPGLK